MLANPRLAEAIADRLRERIFSGQFGELPKQDALIREFNVGLVTVREALRMLEVEGLVTIKRGNMGGATVHPPESRRMAYMLALSLQSDRVNLADLLTTLKAMEPLLARLCAERSDRASAVMPPLAAIVEAQRAALDDPAEFVALAVRFHSVLAEVAGTTTMGMILTALEDIWSAQIDRLTRRTVRHDGLGAREARERALGEHERLLALIAKGDGDGAEQAARDHIATSYRAAIQGRQDYELEIEIDASHLRY